MSSLKVAGASLGLLFVIFIFMVLIGTAEKIADDAIFKNKLALANTACAKAGAVPVVHFAVPQLGELTPERQIMCAVK